MCTAGGERQRMLPACGGPAFGWAIVTESCGRASVTAGFLAATVALPVAAFYARVLQNARASSAIASVYLTANGMPGDPDAPRMGTGTKM